MMSVGTPSVVESELLAFVRARTGPDFAAEQDVFAEGGMTSLFAMQLVVHIEDRYGVRIGGADLKVDNFRTVRAMAALVDRLRAR
jgi:methoxymalonate biosynthesis acyl carrier protein